MRIHVDYARCEGHGQCAAVSPEIVSLDDDANPVLVFQGEVPEEHHADAMAAVSCCPVAALSVS